MKDLGERLGFNIDSNQKHVKDHTKPFKANGGRSPKRAADGKPSTFEDYKPPRKKLFKKIKKRLLNVDKIPGSQGYEKEV